jgi:geranylgeranyl pyrophosphate synthase
MTTTRETTARELAALYGPVGADLPRVDEMLTSLQHVEFPWLRQMLEATLTGGGKRLRPAIALLAGRLGNYDLEKLVPLAASVELLHTATLIHDDVIDAAQERRGKPTAAALFNNASSVMLGDYMFAHAAEFVARTGNIRVIRNFADTLRVMANGELTQDMSAFEYSADVQRYLDRIYGKTASLFATAAEGGAIVTGAPEEVVAPMRAFGEHVGMAFQIVDDILDFSATSEELGKPTGSDLLSGTLTLPTLLYMDRNPEDNPVRRAFDGTRRRANLARAVEEIRASDILEESMVTARHFGEQARADLAQIPASEPRATLEALVDYVLSRRS